MEERTKNHVFRRNPVAPERQSLSNFTPSESYRKGGKVKTRTIANLSHAKPGEIEAIRYALKHKRQLPQLKRASLAAEAPAVSAAAAAKNLILLAL